MPAKKKWSATIDFNPDAIRYGHDVWVNGLDSTVCFQVNLPDDRKAIVRLSKDEAIHLMTKLSHLVN